MTKISGTTSGLPARIFTLLMFLACFAGVLKCQEAKAAPKPHPEYVVSTKWLADHLTDPKLVIIHMGNPDEFKAGHIPGARLLTGNKIAGQGTELLPDDQLKANLEALGISDDSRVVIYTAGWQPMAARVFFTLDYVGFNNAALLDGGFDAWQEEKRAVSTEEPVITKGSLTLHPRPEIVAKLDVVRQVVNTPGTNTAIIDARPLRRYRQGHLPGAVPMFWEKNLVSADDLVQLLKKPDDLRKMYAAAGVTPGKKIISYCEVGLQASYAYFIARYLGYDAAMYDGSYDEWSKEKQPSIRGDNAR